MPDCLKEAQWLADEAQNIADRLRAGDVPLKAINEDMAQLMYGLSKLRTEILKYGTFPAK